MPETATTSPVDPRGAFRLFDEERELEVGTVADIAELEGLSIEAVYQSACDSRPINGISYNVRRPDPDKKGLQQPVALPKAGLMPDGTRSSETDIKRTDLEPGGVAEFDAAGRLGRIWKTREAAAREIGVSLGMLQSLMALQASHKGCVYQNSLASPRQGSEGGGDYGRSPFAPPDQQPQPPEEDTCPRRPIRKSRPFPIAASTSRLRPVTAGSTGAGVTPANPTVATPAISPPPSPSLPAASTTPSTPAAAVPSSTSEVIASSTPENPPPPPNAAGESRSTAPVGAGVEEPFKESVVVERQGKPVRAVELLLTDGTVDRRFESAKLAAAYMGCSSSGITLAIRSGNPCKGRMFRWAGSAEQPVKPSAALVAAAVVQDLGGRNLISAAIDELKKRVVKMQEAIALLEQVGG